MNYIHIYHFFILCNYTFICMIFMYFYNIIYFIHQHCIYRFLLIGCHEDLEKVLAKFFEFLNKLWANIWRVLRTWINITTGNWEREREASLVINQIPIQLNRKLNSRAYPFGVNSRNFSDLFFFFEEYLHLHLILLACTQILYLILSIYSFRDFI